MARAGHKAQWAIPVSPAQMVPKARQVLWIPKVFEAKPDRKARLVHAVQLEKRESLALPAPKDLLVQRGHRALPDQWGQLALLESPAPKALPG